VDPGIPGTEQGAVIPDVDEALEIRGDALPHILIKRLLLGAQIRGRNDGQAHAENSNGLIGLGIIGFCPGDDK
jgi:hypothetical protein